MNKTQRTWTTVVAGALMALALVAPSQALAGPHGPGPMGGPGGPARYHTVLPGECTAVVVDGIRFFYGAGVFYRHSPAGYAVVAPPMGAVVPRLPPGYTVVVANGLTYYVYDGAYYRPAPAGYVVVQQPQVVVVQPAPQATQQTTAQAAVSDLPDTVTLVIDNPNGSRTPVTLKRVPDGWKGPKGEIYDKLPTSDQLAPYYGLGASGSGSTL